MTWFLAIIYGYSLLFLSVTIVGDLRNSISRSTKDSIANEVLEIRSYNNGDTSLFIELGLSSHLLQWRNNIIVYLLYCTIISSSYFTITHLNITYVVHIVSQFFASLISIHWVVVLHIFLFLREILLQSFTFPYFFFIVICIF